MELFEPDQERMTKFWTGLQELWLTLYGTSYPTVAAINVSISVTRVYIKNLHACQFLGSQSSRRLFTCM